MSDITDVQVTVQQLAVDVQVTLAPEVVVVSTGVPGPPGLDGTSGGMEFVQATPAGTWTIPHTLNRLPVVSLHDVDGREFESDVTSTATQVVITHAVPTAGTATLA